MSRSARRIPRRWPSSQRPPKPDTIAATAGPRSQPSTSSGMRPRSARPAATSDESIASSPRADQRRVRSELGRRRSSAATRRQSASSRWSRASPTRDDRHALGGQPVQHEVEMRIGEPIAAIRSDDLEEPRRGDGEDASGLGAEVLDPGRQQRVATRDRRPPARDIARPTEPRSEPRSVQPQREATDRRDAPARARPSPCATPRTRGAFAARPVARAAAARAGRLGGTTISS